MPRLVVCLPCYNEAPALPSLIERLALLSKAIQPAWQLECLLIDDGSSDASADVLPGALGSFAAIIRHESNSGLGSSVMDAVRWFNANRAPEDVLAIMDADLTHPPELLPRMLAAMEAEQVGIVVASRYAPGGSESGLPRRRLFFSRLANLVLRGLGRIPQVRDYTCGYRLYRGAALMKGLARYGERLVQERGFTCMAELLLKLGATGVRCTEVGLPLDYGQKRGPSKMRVAATIRRYAVLCLRLLFDPDFRPRGR